MGRASFASCYSPFRITPHRNLKNLQFVITQGEDLSPDLRTLEPLTAVGQKSAKPLPGIDHIHIPREILDFFIGKQSQSLLVKGGTGTGKTTFALEILNHLSHNQVGVCVFTRIERDD